MFIFHLPTTAIGWIIDHFFAVGYFTSIGFRISLFGADILLLLLLLQSFENHWKKVLIYYWLSPLVLFITYWHGQTDLIPVALFIYALTLVKRGNYWAAGLILACSIAAKHSMIIGVPFIILYLWSHNGINKELQRFLTFFIGSLFVIEDSILFFRCLSNDGFGQSRSWKALLVVYKNGKRQLNLSHTFSLFIVTLFFLEN